MIKGHLRLLVDIRLIRVIQEIFFFLNINGGAMPLSLLNIQLRFYIKY